MNILKDIWEIVKTPFEVGKAFVDCRPSGAAYRTYTRNIHADVDVNGKVLLVTGDAIIGAVTLNDRAMQIEMDSSAEAKLWFTRGVTSGISAISNLTRSSMAPGLKIIKAVQKKEAEAQAKAKAAQKAQEAMPSIMPPASAQA